MVYWWIHYMGLHKSLLHACWNIFTLNLLLFQLKNPGMTPSTPPLVFHSAWALSPWSAWCCWVWPSSCLAASTCGSSDMSALDVASLLQWTVNQKPWLGWCEVSAPTILKDISIIYLCSKELKHRIFFQLYKQKLEPFWLVTLYMQKNRDII